MSDKSDQPTLSIVDRLLGIDWFVSVGEPIDSQPAISVQPVHSWEEAVRECTSENWSNTQLEARNILTRGLSAAHRSEYRKWNQHVDHTKELLTLDLMQLDRRVAELGIDPIVASSAKWDVISAVMEETYGDLSSFRFFTQLICFYERGHFPYGWRGEVPRSDSNEWRQGEIIVY
jgi:hypothetical protein